MKILKIRWDYSSSCPRGVQRLESSTNRWHLTKAYWLILVGCLVSKVVVGYIRCGLYMSTNSSLSLVYKVNTRLIDN